MPNRILKESITTSVSLANLTAEEERHFYRLMVQADDYGCFQAHPAIIRASGYGLLLDKVTTLQSKKWTAALVRENIIHLYEANGKPYGHFVNWAKYQQIRAQRRKWPEPSCDITCNQVKSDVLVIQSESNPNPIRIQESGAKAPQKKRRVEITTLTAAALIGLFNESEKAEMGKVFPGINLDWEAGKCVGWHNAKGGSGNWKLAFKNWLGNAKPTSGIPTKPEEKIIYRSTPDADGHYQPGVIPKTMLVDPRIKRGL